jgi:dihydropteroate synthase
MQLVSGNKRLDLQSRVAVVAILNATPDSYHPGGRSTDPALLAAYARQAIADGADLLEIGGESTGPRSPDVTAEQELDRVLPALYLIRGRFPQAWISVDTTKAIVAQAALTAGADMINDVSAGRADEAMFSVIARHHCPYVLMYAKDPTSRTVQEDVQYDDVIATIFHFLSERIAAAKEAGVATSTLIIDPGLGHFISSDARYSYEIIRRLEEFKALGPIFVSPSRKSFLAGPKNLPVDQRLPATLAATAVAVQHGATFIRTHDVGETREVVDAVLRM